jgi:hypothetical protein
VSRCLSERALLRVHVGDGTPTEQAHLARCAACAMRTTALRTALDRVSQVLAATTEPRPRPARRASAWLPAIGVTAMAVAVLLGWQTALHRASLPGPSTGRPPELGSLLEDVSTVMFSVSGDPGVVELQFRLDEGLPGVLEAGCDPADWAGLGCGGSWDAAGASL